MSPVRFHFFFDFVLFICFISVLTCTFCSRNGGSHDHRNDDSDAIPEGSGDEGSSDDSDDPDYMPESSDDSSYDDSSSVEASDSDDDASSSSDEEGGDGGGGVDDDDDGDGGGDRDVEDDNKAGSGDGGVKRGEAKRKADDDDSGVDESGKGNNTSRWDQPLPRPARNFLASNVTINHNVLSVMLAFHMAENLNDLHWVTPITKKKRKKDIKL